MITLNKGDKGLGFSILDYQDPLNMSETVIVVRSLVPGGNVKSALEFRGKFIYSERATKFGEIYSVDLSYVVPVKSMVKILQNFVAFSE